MLASGRDYEPGRLAADSEPRRRVRTRSSGATPEAKEIARFYDRPIGKRVRSVDAEAHRHGLTAVLARVGEVEGAIAARLASARPVLEVIADEFAAAQR